MESSEPGYRIEVSNDGERWRPMPRGFRQDGVVLDRVDGVVIQSTGRGGAMFYRAVAAE
jgi:hypothetical protein